VDPLASSSLLADTTEIERVVKRDRSTSNLLSKKESGHRLFKVKRTSNMQFAEPSRSKTKKGKD
jgi:hypothetical protein